MDFIAHMSDDAQLTYTINQALESIDNIDNCMLSNAAMEGISKDVEKSTRAMNEKINVLLGQYQKCVDDGDTNGAMKVIDETEKVIDAQIEYMKNMPPEKFRGVKTVAKILVLILGFIATLKMPMLAAKIAGQIGKALPSVGSNSLFRGGLSLAMQMGTSNITSGPALKQLFQGIAAGSKKDFEKVYGENPNAKNATYRLYFKSIIEAKKYLSDLRAATRSSMSSSENKD